MATLATSPPPHLDALRRANEIRVARAKLKHQIGEGTISVGDVLLACPLEVAGMTIVELLTSQEGWGTKRCRSFLAGIGMPETKSIGSLTERQRRVLAGLF